MISFSSGGYSIDLPNPELGDSEQYNIKTKFKMAMTGAVFSYKNTPVSSRLLLSFTNLTDANKTALKTFIEDVIGSVITYVDYLSQTWTGYIITNPFEIDTYGRRPCRVGGEQEAHKITLEFEGVR